MSFRNLLFLVLPVWLVLPGSGTAQDLFGLCETADERCYSLAVEVEKIRATDGLSLGRPGINPGNLLCTQDNPNCCPPHLMPVCMAHAGVIVDQALSKVIREGIVGGCPWSREVCDGFGSFYCEPEQNWNPWAGCHDAVVVVDPQPPTWVCPEGQRPAAKPPICEPIPCFHPIFNIEVPCAPTNGDLGFAQIKLPDGADMPDNAPVGNLLRLMATEDVRQEANTALKREFGRELERMRNTIGSVAK